MTDAPWVKFYPSDWLAGTSVLTASERGVYITLVALIYEHGGPIPYHEGRLARGCGLTKGSFARSVASLVDQGKLEIVDGHLTNRRAVIELSEREKRSQKARRSAEARWHAPGEKTQQNQGSLCANASPEHCSGDAIQKPEARDQNPEGDSPPYPPFAASACHDEAAPEPPPGPSANVVPIRRYDRLRIEQDLFPRFWEAFPNDVRRGEALAIFRRLVEDDGEDPETIIRAAKGYAAEVADQEPRYIRHAPNWLRAMPWHDPPSSKESRPMMDPEAIDPEAYYRRLDDGTYEPCDPDFPKAVKGDEIIVWLRHQRVRAKAKRRGSA